MDPTMHRPVLAYIHRQTWGRRPLVRGHPIRVGGALYEAASSRAVRGQPHVAALAPSNAPRVPEDPERRWLGLAVEVDAKAHEEHIVLDEHAGAHATACRTEVFIGWRSIDAPAVQLEGTRLCLDGHRHRPFY
eukprot:scaffold2090_cov225-Prasinococcus_capsulatus_cf.AAC.42